MVAGWYVLIVLTWAKVGGLIFVVNASYGLSYNSQSECDQAGSVMVGPQDHLSPVKHFTYHCIAVDPHVQ